MSYDYSGFQMLQPNYRKASWLSLAVEQEGELVKTVRDLNNIEMTMSLLERVVKTLQKCRHSAKAQPGEGKSWLDAWQC